MAWPFLTLLAAPAFLPAVFTSLPRYPPVIFFVSSHVPASLAPVPEEKPLLFKPSIARAYYSDVHSHPLARLASIATWVSGIIVGVFVLRTLHWIAERTRKATTSLGKARLFQVIGRTAGWIEVGLSRAFRRTPSAFKPSSNALCPHHQSETPACPIGPCPAAAASDADNSLESCLEHREFCAAVVNFYAMFLIFCLVILNLPWVYDRLLSAAFSVSRSSACLR